MVVYAFNDGFDGYYEVNIADGETLPEWCKGMTPCAVNSEKDSAEYKLMVFKGSARKLLNDTEISNSRIITAIILGKTTSATADVVNWFTWRDSVRLYVAATQVGVLPAQVPYPLNT